MKKRICSIALSVLMCLAMFGCSGSTAGSDNAPKQTPEPQIETSVGKYKINQTSTIEDDFDLFGLEMTAGQKNLALFDICAMFPDETTVYLYLRMPEDTDQVEYRAQSIVINDKKYETSLLEAIGSSQKYALENFDFREDNIYTISEVDFTNEKVEDSTETYNMSQIIVMALDDTSFVFSQEYEYDVTLDGQLFESVYQFNKDNNAFVDFWSRAIGNIDQLDLDKRSFFYFGFNCYDVKRDIQFIPEQIKQLDVEYTRLSYSYQGNDKDSYLHPVALSKDISETILPEHYTVLAANEKRSRKLAYEYDTINKLNEADLTQNVNVSNTATLQQIAKQYTWAVQFGDELGYDYLKEKAGVLWMKDYDVRYTEIADFKAIYIVYVYDGATFDTKTNSLIRDEPDPQPIIEPTLKPTTTQKLKYDLTAIWNSEEIVFVKLYQTLGLFYKEIIKKIAPFLIAAVILFALYHVAKYKLKVHHHRRQESDEENPGLFAFIKEWFEDTFE